MKFSRRVLLISTTIVILFPGCKSTFAEAKATDLDIIVTAAPIYRPLAALRGGERFPEGAQLLRLHGGKTLPLVQGFAASADANVSFDGNTVLFAGKHFADDPWQVWELSVQNGSLRRLIGSTNDSIRPFYLPAGQLVYASHTPTGYQLVVAGRSASSMLAPIDTDAGSMLLPLSHFPGSAIPAEVLLDGRILFEALFPLGSGTTPELYLVYSDGSGVESYRCDHGHARWGGRQLASGDVVFTHGTSLGRFTSPQAHEVPVIASRSKYAGGIAETASGEWLVSRRITSSAHFGLGLLKYGSAESEFILKQSVLAIEGEDIVDPVLIEPRSRPHHHPTALHPWTYANLLALDSRVSREGDLRDAPATVRLETLDPLGRVVANGTAPVESDGSFFVQVPADRPIRIALINAKGTVLRQDMGGSGFAVVSSASALGVTQDRNTLRRIASQAYCCGPRLQWI